MDLRPFLRIQNDAWLNALRDKLAEDILANVMTTSFSHVGKSGTQQVQVNTADLANQLAEVLMERDIGGASAQAPVRMTLARIC